jgi:hypothetical protein
MANTIKIKNKTTPGIPIATQLENKELVMHEVDNSLYYKRETDNAVIKVNTSGGVQNVFIQDSEPVAAIPFIWFETDALGKIIDIKQSI